MNDYELRKRMEDYARDNNKTIEELEEEMDLEKWRAFFEEQDELEQDTDESEENAEEELETDDIQDKEEQSDNTIDIRDRIHLSDIGKDRDEKEEEEEEKEDTINIGMMKKIENILDNDRLIKIYSILPDKETKRDFLDTLLSHYSDRLSEKLDARIQDEFEAVDKEIKQNELNEDIKNQRSIRGIFRSREREPIRQGVTERINALTTAIVEGNYITNEDKEFLVKHLAGRGTFGGTSVAEERDYIRGIIDTYVDAKNTELGNVAKTKAYNQNLQKEIIETKEQLAYLYGKPEFGGEDGDALSRMESDLAKLKEMQKNDPDNIALQNNINKKESDIQNYVAGSDFGNSTDKSMVARLEAKLKKLEELQMSSDPSDSSNKSMLHGIDSTFDIDANNMDLEELMGILDKESEKLTKEGIKLPERGIKESDDIFKGKLRADGKEVDENTNSQETDKKRDDGTISLSDIEEATQNVQSGAVYDNMRDIAQYDRNKKDFTKENTFEKE